MSLLYFAAVSVFMVTPAVGTASTSSPITCFALWHFYEFDAQNSKCYSGESGGCHAPSDTYTTCRACQIGATGREDVLKDQCLDPSIFINPELRPEPCEENMRWIFESSSGKCTQRSYKCVINPELFGFADEDTCKKSCQGVPQCTKKPDA